MVTEEVASLLTPIYNEIISRGTWPEQWKWEEWTPVFKKDDALNKCNYRPVTVLVTVDKVFEQLLAGQLEPLSNKVFDGLNLAHSKRYSCETTLVRLVEDWKRSLHNNHTVGVSSTDMSKTFDCLSPDLVLSKLQAYGLCCNSLAILKSYFTSRKNRVRLGDTCGEWKAVKRGCPQGSSLGQVLWNFYQNDLFYENIRSQLSAYADDHQIYISGEKIDNVVSSIEEDGNTTGRWYKSNYLSGNPSTYQVLVMSRAKEEVKKAVPIDSHTIRQAQEIKLLGVILYVNLQFLEHIKQICTKTSRRIGVLSRLRNLIPTTAKLTIYKTAVMPHFTYCSLVWHFCKASDRRKLERINERRLRTVYNDWSSSYDDLLSRAKMTTLYNRRLQDIAIFMFKIKHGMLPSSVTEPFNTSHTNYNLRNADFRQYCFNTTKYGKHSLRQFGPKSTGS